jgi:hypothetical protein
MTDRSEVKDFKVRAYRTLNDGDKKFQNWAQASTVLLELVVEIDGVEFPIVRESISRAQWDRALRHAGKVTPELSSELIPPDLEIPPPKLVKR